MVDFATHGSEATSAGTAQCPKQYARDRARIPRGPKLAREAWCLHESPLPRGSPISRIDA